MTAMYGRRNVFLVSSFTREHFATVGLVGSISGAVGGFIIFPRSAALNCPFLTPLFVWYPLVVPEIDGGTALPAM